MSVLKELVNDMLLIIFLLGDYVHAFGYVIHPNVN